MPVLSTVGAASLGAFGAFKGLGANTGFIVATGGTIYVDPTDANYKIHEFTSSGTFTVTNAASNATLQCLLVAGGGAGAKRGGGAGGYIYRPALAITTGSYSVSIGLGGVFNTSGGDSSFAGLVAIGGAGTAASNGGSGSGGAGAFSWYLYGSGLQPTSASGGYGNNGAAAASAGTDGGGGGGAGSAASGYIGGSGRAADIINSSGLYETMSSGGWGVVGNVAYALPAVGYGTGGWGGLAGDVNGNYVEDGDGGAGILRVRYKFQ